MNCPTCNAATVKVTDSRPVDGGASVRRRRKCLACGYRWITYELDADQLPAENRAMVRVRTRPTRRPRE